MSQREWVQFVKDCKVPIPITEINDVFRRVDRAEKDVRPSLRRRGRGVAPCCHAAAALHGG